MIEFHDLTADVVGKRPYNATANDRHLAYRLGPHYHSRIAVVSIYLGRVLKTTTRLLPKLFSWAVSYEDPRLWESSDGPRLIVTMYGKTNNTDFTQLACCTLEGKEAQLLAWPSQQRVEKNWLIFSRGRETWLSYSMQAGVHRVGHLSEGSVKYAMASPYAFPWSHGDVRGGTPPVLHDNLWWTFFHSTRWAPKEHYFYKDYVLGAIAFEDKPPFNVVGMTPQPLWQPSRPEIVVNKWVMSVVFPGSARLHKNRWEIMCGINDCKMGYLSMDHQHVVRSMVW